MRFALLRLRQIGRGVDLMVALRLDLVGPARVLRNRGAVLLGVGVDGVD
jgi:hypothetical protein